MKKTAIAFAVAAFATAAVQAAPQANTFYAGARAGWSQAHQDLNALKDAGYDVKRNDVTYGVFGGYQIIDNLAAELAYDNFGGIKVKDDESTDKMRNHGASLSLKGSYPIIDGLDAYARVGAALIRTDYKIDGAQQQHSLKVTPVYAAGFEYAPMPELGLRLEYSWLNKVGKFEDEDGNREHFAPKFGAVTLGASYRFGQAAPVAPVQVSETFALNSDVTFAFGKAQLKPEAEVILNDVYAQIADVKAEKMTVAGYTDRIGSEKYNEKLSQERAAAVAAFLEGKGVPAEVITVAGYGEANPVVACDNLRGKALIKCLAPNRRVEIAVEGTK